MTTQPLAAGSPASWADNTPVIANANRIIREGAPIPTFCEDTWNLAAMAPTRRRDTLVCKFESIPVEFKKPVKMAVWLLINEGKPDGVVRRGSTNAKKWISAGAITQFLNQIRSFLRFVARETPEVRSLGGIVSETMDSYINSLMDRVDSRYALAHYGSIRLLHDITASLPARQRLRAPSWVDDKVFISRTGPSDNATPPMPEAVLTPMLLWSVAFVEQFADDILSAGDTVNSYVPPTIQSTPISRRQAMDLVVAWTKHHQSLPCTDVGSGGIAVSYMCFLLGWPIRFERSGLRMLLI